MSVFTSIARYFRPDTEKTSGLKASDDELLGLSINFSTFRGGQLTPKRVAYILNDAAEGCATDQAAMFLDMIEKEGTIRAHLQTRKLAVTGKGWKVSSEKNPKIAKEISEILKNAKISKLISYLCDSVSLGYAGAVIDWDKGGAGIKGFVPIHPSLWEFDLAGYPALYTLEGGTKALSSWHENQFCWMAYPAHSGIPSMQGLMRTLAWLYLFKHVGVKNWSRFVERFGIPFTSLEVAAEDFKDKGKVAKFLAALRSVGAQGYGVHPVDSKMEFHNAITSGNIDAFERLSRYFDEIFTIMILGQLASSDTAGGMSNGTAQDNVRQDIIEADASAISDIVQDQVLLPLVKMRYGWSDLKDLKFEIDATPPEDQKEKADTYKVLTEVTGRKIKAEQITEEFGVEFEEAQEPPEQLQKPPAPEKKELTSLSDTRAETALNAIVVDAMQKTIDDPEVLGAWFNPVKDAIHEAFSDCKPDDMDDFKKRIPLFLDSLPGILDEMDSSAFEKHLSGAMLAAAINGAESVR